MDTQLIAIALRNKASEVRNVNVATAEEDQTLRDAAELLRVLARVVEGKPLARSFGAPGDWGDTKPRLVRRWQPFLCRRTQS